jgi:hypothetical protein
MENVSTCVAPFRREKRRRFAKRNIHAHFHALGVSNSKKKMVDFMDLNNFGPFISSDQIINNNWFDAI